MMPVIQANKRIRDENSQILFVKFLHEEFTGVYYKNATVVFQARK